MNTDPQSSGDDLWVMQVGIPFSHYNMYPDTQDDLPSVNLIVHSPCACDDCKKKIIQEMGESIEECTKQFPMMLLDRPSWTINEHGGHMHCYMRVHIAGIN